VEVELIYLDLISHHQGWLFGVTLFIGKQGRTAQAIRSIMSAVAGKKRKRYIMEIVE
jgi:hypothetical protein